jgi:hypothetical protein
VTFFRNAGAGRNIVVTQEKSSLATGPIPYAEEFFHPGGNCVQHAADVPVHEKAPIVDAGSAGVHENFPHVAGGESIENVQESCQESDDAMHAGRKSRGPQKPARDVTQCVAVYAEGFFRVVGGSGWDDDVCNVDDPDSPTADGKANVRVPIFRVLHQEKNRDDYSRCRATWGRKPGLFFLRARHEEASRRVASLGERHDGKNRVVRSVATRKPAESVGVSAESVRYPRMNRLSRHRLLLQCP